MNPGLDTQSERPKITTIAALEAFERVPLEDRLACANVYDWLRRGASFDADGAAIIALTEGTAEETPRIVTFKELLANVERAANLLSELGIGIGDAVTIMLPIVPEAHFATWGAELAGIACPTNPALHPEHIAALVEASKSQILIAAGPALDPAIWSSAKQVYALCPGLKALLFVGGGCAEEPGILDFDRRLTAAPSGGLSTRRIIDKDEVAAYFHTGGTTGAPKLAIQTHWGQVYQSWVLGFHTDYNPGDRLLMGLPLFHNAGLIHNGLSALGWGTTVVLLHPQGFRHKPMLGNFWKIASRYRGTGYMGVPTIQAALLDADMTGADISALRCTVSGAAPAPRQLIEELERRLRVRVIEGYGLTEATCACTLNPIDGERRAGSIGIRLLYEELQIAELDEEGRFVRTCAPGEVGTILIRGPHVFRGYLSGDATPFAAPGWLNTGDLARQDAEGYVWIAGRSKDLIIRGGHNIEPAMIEQAIYEHPDVEFAAAVGRPDAYAGEVPVAYVTLKAGSVVTAAELTAFARTHVKERGAAPVAIHVLDMMPLTAVGKIFKPPLRLMAAREALELGLASLAQSAGIELRVSTFWQEKTLAAAIEIRAKDIDRRSDLEDRVASIATALKIAVEISWIHEEL